MNSIGSTIKECREKWGLPLKKVAAYIDINMAALKRIEQGKQLPTRQQVIELAEYFNEDENEFIIYWLCDQLSSEAAFGAGEV